jgi:hypothetical protein
VRGKAALSEQSVARRAEVLAVVCEEALQVLRPAVFTSTIWLGISGNPSLEVGIVLGLQTGVTIWLVETEVCDNLITQTTILRVSMYFV